MDVSIIILAHKESEYLDKCILSAKNQKFNGNFEIILSSDNETKLENIANKYDIKFNLCTDNKLIGSCSANLNSGVRMSQGKYIKVLPYDDWLNEDSIQILYDGIENTNHSLIFANALNVKSDSTSTLIKPTLINNFNSLVHTNFIHGGTTLFKKEDFVSLGGYRTDLKCAEEYDFHLRLLKNGKTFTYIDKVVFNYRIHSNQKGTTALSVNDKIEKRKVVNTIQRQFTKRKIVCGVASMYSRKEGLKETVHSIINQVDKLIVYQNGYKEMFDFLKNDKIEVYSSIDTNIDMGDAGKFFKVSEYKDCYYFSIDDDLIYPPNYVLNTIKNLNLWGDKVIVTYHGRILSHNAKSYYRDKIKVNHCLHEQVKDEFIQFGGTGVMAFCTDMVKIPFEYFKKPNMADVWVGKYAQDNRIPILSLKHNKLWIKETDYKDSNTIFNSHSKKDNGQDSIINTYNKEIILRYDLLENKVISNNPKNDTNTQLSIIIPTFNHPDFLNECLNSVISSVKKSPCEILVGIDDCKKTIEFIKNKTFDSRIKFFKFNKNVGPYVIKNSLSLIANSDYILFFDSDDIMKEELIQDIINHKSSYDLIKPMYLDFGNHVKNINYKVTKSSTYGEGVFAIKKDLFFNMGGFEDWRCAADSELMNRLYKKKIKLTHTKNIGFYRRVHQNSLTQHPETGLKSKLRRDYSKKIKTLRKGGDIITEPFTKINVNNIPVLEINPLAAIKNKRDILLNEVINLKIGDKEKKSVPIDYDKINRQGVFNPKQHKKELIQTKTKEQPIILKEDSITKLKREMFKTKPKRKDDSPNIFGNNQRRKGGFSI